MIDRDFFYIYFKTMLIILLIILGFGVGSLLPIDMKYLPIIGMVLTTYIPLTSISIIMLLSGYFVASFLKSSFINDVKEQGMLNAVSNVKETLTSFTTGVAIYYFLDSSAASSVVFMGISIVQILFWLYLDITQGHKKGTIRKLIGFLILNYLATTTVGNISKLAIFAYFTGLITVPSLLFNLKQTKKSPNGDFCNAFSYGMNYSGPSYTGIVLAQTIMAGSAKDMLGTILNLSLSTALDPYRFIWALAFIGLLGFFYYYGIDFINAYPDNGIERKFNSNKNGLTLVYNLVNNDSSEWVNFGIATFSIYIVAMTLGIGAATIIIGLGLVAHMCLGERTTAMFSVPMLLIAGLMNS